MPPPNDDPFILRRRLLVLVIFCIAIINTALLVPSNKFSDSFLETAVKVLGVIVSLSIFIVCLLWMCGRVLGGAHYDDSIILADAAATSGGEFNYDTLSKQQKKHLDRLRTAAIRLLLGNFSMRLKQENMITSRYEGTAENEELLEYQINSIYDEEEGGYNDARGDNNYAQEVMIHLPDQNCRLTRECPISCAICLTEYEVSNDVCWSANQKCPHIFHEKCITKWFLSLGRLQSISDLSLEDECPKKVLNYQLECPCCRQEFISVSE